MDSRDLSIKVNQQQIIINSISVLACSDDVICLSVDTKAKRPVCEFNDINDNGQAKFIFFAGWETSYIEKTSHPTRLFIDSVNKCFLKLLPRQRWQINIECGEYNTILTLVKIRAPEVIWWNTY